jgi:hypothetical protein
MSQNTLKILPYRAENITMRAKLLTPAEMAYALEITEYALHALVHNGVISHTYIHSSVTQEHLLRFDPYIITEWMHTNPKLDVFTEKNHVDALKDQLKTNFPHVLTTLKTLNAEFSPPHKGKGYRLTKVKTKNTVSFTTSAIWNTAKLSVPVGTRAQKISKPQSALRRITASAY